MKKLGAEKKKKTFIPNKKQDGFPPSPCSRDSQSFFAQKHLSPPSSPIGKETISVRVNQESKKRQELKTSTVKQKPIAKKVIGTNISDLEHRLQELKLDQEKTTKSIEATSRLLQIAREQTTGVIGKTSTASQTSSSLNTTSTSKTTSTPVSTNSKSNSKSTQPRRLSTNR